MYVKYLMNRIKTTPSNAWKDWISFRNYPGMQYRDVHDIVPKSYMWKFPSPGSAKYELNGGLNDDYFKWDYKTAYRNSIYFVRRIFNELPKKPKSYNYLPISEQDIKEFSDRDPNWKAYYDQNNYVSCYNETKNLSLEDRHEQYGNVVATMHETRDLLEEYTSDAKMKNLYDTYFPVYDNFGSEKNADPSDMDPKFLYIYFDNLQHLYNDDEMMKETNDNKQNIYVGRTKAWQVVPDFYGKDQVDKVQAAIGAPLQDQLDEWENENSNKKVQMPITNENVHKFRDDPDHYENLDHDYDRIVYERSKKQKNEQMRNFRYEELLQLYHKNNIQ